ncbi:MULTISPECIES: hypothetical protein [unclassified Frigoribacterium]|uniref:hypothetical protein n=1 Tax=unclassified Frigoribacterium TaxID=2627005 RepID=UPI000FB2ACF2|nr:MULTISPECIES: hypothetical protein [unclassified Frigoribacterium]ROP78620.1 hypothetical protein EDF18_1275 [Frigoribacterium sp. PhB107]TDT66413.1 hypothetical protein EDF20_1226 [Frigoribacterium sp. PhB116]
MSYEEPMVAYDYGPSFSSILTTLAAVALLGLGIALAVLLMRLVLVATRALTVFSRERELRLETLLAESGAAAPPAPAAASAPATAAPASAPAPAAPPASAAPAPPSADGDRTEDTCAPDGDAPDGGDVTPR